ncbi:MAG: GNAT family N-acetyltransferase [Leeuwenhoekiella sp.]
MPNKSWKAEEIDKHQVAIIHKLAHEIWPQTYSDLLSEGQIVYMLNMMYSIESLENQIASGHKMYVFKYNEQETGFLVIEHNKDESNKTKVHKIYLQPKHQGTGLGKIMMDFAAEKALESGDKSLFLNVNRQNSALGFYEHYGYKKMYSEDNDIGEGYLMEDYVMEKEL